MLDQTIASASRPKPTTPGMTAKELMLLKLPPLKTVIDGYLVEGLTLLAGPPKMGKSWMALDFANAVANGGVAFGSVPATQGAVLYLALEDNFRRLQDRLGLMGIVEGSDNLRFATEWPNLDDTCVEQLEQWVSETENPKLIVIDVYARIKGQTSAKDGQYQGDYKFVGKLQKMAIANHIAIVLIHHTRKQSTDDPFDAISGTRGINGAADTMLVIMNDPDSRQPVLHARGRDIESFERTLEFQSSTRIWRVVGEGRVGAKTVEQTEVLKVLVEVDRDMTPSELADALGKERTTVQRLLGKLVDQGKVTKIATGRYRHSL